MAQSAANALRDAMKGFGTNESALINVVANLGPNDIAPLIATYKKEFDRDLIADIKDETGGSFEDSLVALLTPVIEYDARLCKKAMSGIGTDEQLLIDIICTRYPIELKALEDEYKHIFAHDLVDDVNSDVGGDFKKVLLHRLRASEEKGEIDQDVEHLYKAGQGKIGTDEAVFINILSHRSKEYLYSLNTAYANKYGKSLPAVIESEMSGDLKKALIAIVTPPAEYFCERLRKAMAGIGTDDATLVRIIASQRYRTLKGMAAIWLSRYNTTLKKAISDEISGDYKKLIVAVIERISENKIPNV